MCRTQREDRHQLIFPVIQRNHRRRMGQTGLDVEPIQRQRWAHQRAYNVWANGVPHSAIVGAGPPIEARVDGSLF